MSRTSKDDLVVIVVLIRETMLSCEATERPKRSNGQFLRFRRQSRAKEAAFAYNVPKH